MEWNLLKCKDRWMDSGFIGRIWRNVRYENIYLEQEIRSGTLPTLLSAPQDLSRKTVLVRYDGFMDISNVLEWRKN